MPDITPLYTSFLVGFVVLAGIVIFMGSVDVYLRVKHPEGHRGYEFFWHLRDFITLKAIYGFCAIICQAFMVVTNIFK